MYYSHHNTQLRYKAKEQDLIRLRKSNGLVGYVMRSIKRR
jgi:hypothetical protein